MFSVVFISILLRLSPGLCQKIGNGYGIKCRIGTSERKLRIITVCSNNREQCSIKKKETRKEQRYVSLLYFFSKRECDHLLYVPV